MNNNNLDELDKFVEENYRYNKLKRKKQKKIIIILINIITISCLVGGGIGLKSIYDYKKDLKESKSLQEKLDKYYVELERKQAKLEENQEYEKINDEKKEETIIDFSPLLATNSDTIGWLTVKGTSINLPIVQTTDNEYYLTHNFERNWNSLGWAFADYRNNFSNLDKNTIFYGHTYKDSLIFSSLTNLLKDDWLNNPDNYIIDFSTIENNLQWEVFSIYTTEETNDYIQTEFSNQEFLEFVDLIKERSIKDFNIELGTDDKILTLSTCYLDSHHRLVVHAKLIS